MTEDKRKTDPKTPKKKPLLIIWFSVALAAIVLIVFIWWGFWGRFFQSTDDAYVHGNQVRLTSQISGIVNAIYVNNTELVEEGQVLVQLDETDRLSTFEQSQAALAEAVRQVTRMFEEVYAAAALLELKRAELLKSEIYYLDRKNVVKMGAVSAEEFIHA